MKLNDKEIKKLYDLVFHTAIKILKNKEDAEDVTQNVFVRVLENMDSFLGRSKLSTWAIAITVNESKNFLRKKHRDGSRVVQFKEGKDEDDYPTTAVMPDPADETYVDELLSSINRKLKNMSDDFVETYLLREVEGKSYKDIANTQNISESSARRRVSEVKSKLKGLF